MKPPVEEEDSGEWTLVKKGKMVKEDVDKEKRKHQIQKEKLKNKLELDNYLQEF